MFTMTLEDIAGVTVIITDQNHLTGMVELSDVKIRGIDDI